MISYEVTDDAIYDPHDPKYWDKDSFERELMRTFDLCHGCRMCFKYCPAFPSLFDAMDTTADADVHKLTEADKQKVFGECYQCKICYVVCPYTATDEHKYNIDFPALMQRATNLDARENGVALRDKALGNPDTVGRMNTGLISRIVNKSMQWNFHRRIMEAILGIHRSKSLPEFHRTSFMRWFKKKKNKNPNSFQPENPVAKVVLFPTCFVNYNNPGLGRAALDVLQKNNCEVECPEGQNCCGMPALESGDLKLAVKKMKQNVNALLPYAEQGYRILAINPTCSLTLKKEYTSYLDDDWRSKAAKVAAATMDPNEFLFELKKEENFNRDFKSSPGKVAYHVPCHLRAQNIGFRSRDMMKTIPEAKIGVVTECCGHNGTWSMKKEYFEMSLDAGKRAFDGLKEQDADVVSTDCPLAAIHLEQAMETSERPMHPLQVLARAYRAPGEGGWSRPAGETEA